MKLIAYGSLMNQLSLERTLGRSAQLSKISLPGWRRVFNAPFDGYAFLNLERAKGIAIEAAYFKLEKRELILFAEREAGSELLEVKPGYYAFVWPRDYCRNLPALESYITLCKAASVELGIDFSAGLSMPPTVINDLHNPIYSA